MEEKISKFIPYGRQDISEDDIASVIQVLSSDFLTQGPMVPKFEEKLKQISGAEHATAVNSATAALHLACLALRVTSDDIVWTVPNTFVASANCALYCGAKIDFVDIDPDTLNISLDCLAEKLKLAEKCGRLPKVLIPVHFSGEPCDMARIRKLSDVYGFKIIEDASHAVGSSYQGLPTGSCKYSDITVFSFHPVKIVTSGEGGAALTNCDALDHRLKLLRSHGITRDRNRMRLQSGDGWYYEQIELGFNYRMSDIHAALGLSQLSRLNEYIIKRHEVAQIYDREFINSNIQIPLRGDGNLSALHLYVIQVEKNIHHDVFHKLRRDNIGVNLHYIPVHTQPFYQDLGFKWGDFPNSEKVYKKSISLPIYPKLEMEQQLYVIDRLNEACNE